MRPPFRSDLRLDPYPMPSMDSVASGATDRAVLSAFPDALLLLDPLGLVRDANPAAERLFGRPLEALRTAALDRLISLPGNGALGALLRSGRLGATERWPGSRGRTIDGQEFDCDLSATPLAGPGAPARWLVVVTPTASRDFALTQRQESAKMSAVATLAAGIANDFNNALAAISGSIETARLRILSQNRVPPRELIEVKEATRGAARLVRRLLNFARPSPGIRKPIDPNRIVEETRQVLDRDLDPRITLVTRLDHGDWRIRADLEQLTDLLVSLGHNAIEAMPHGGVLTLATARAAAGAWGAPAAIASREFVRIEVRDTGEGIPPDVLPRIFEPFFTTKEAGRGSGLGLATAYATLRHHEGGITVESAPGAGSLFQIYLPRTHDVAGEPAPSRAIEPGTGRGTILLVDDEASVRRPLRHGLGLCGYTVVEAADGLEALRLHGQQATHIDLVVLDVKMPGMSGWDVLGELKRRNPSLPVILTSGYTQEDSTPPANASTPDAYIPKPYDLAELTGQVRRLLPNAPEGDAAS
ncbi:MAG TPA: response regulator [Gemmatimonadales bacterium]|nr:response regulator [Gemmatimonadales bacterium]